MKIAFIGGGNMGEAMLAAVLEDGLAKPEAIWVSDVSSTRRKALVQQYGVAAMAGNGPRAAAARESSGRGAGPVRRP